MANRLAITIAGAVSLGSFEAGVLFEVFDALGQHNQASSKEQHIYVDVMTGASAGGMSAAIATQRLLYSASELTDPYNNVFYNAWVTGVDINGLLPLDPSESAGQSILSSDFVKNVVLNFLLGRYDRGPLRTAAPHPALNPHGFIHLGLALSNLNGVDFKRELLSGGTFNYTEFADHITFRLAKEDDQRDAWVPVMNAAVACGAFPFAFRTGELSRQRREYPQQFLAPWPESPRVFTYTDGGVFQNQPLGLAKNLVDLIDQHQESDSRSYLFVSPQGVDPKVATITAATSNFKTLTAALANAVYNQAGFQDWIEAESVNDNITLLNRRADQLLALFEDGTVEAAAIKRIVGLFLRQFGLGVDGLALAREQLREQFTNEYNTLSELKGSGAADVWIDTVLLLELAADLHEKDEMYIYSITAERRDLAGAGLSSFLGFLDQRFREHDYDLGRQKAKDFLVKLAEVSGGRLPVLCYTPQPIHNIAPTPPDGFGPAQIDPDVRQALVDALCGGVRNALKQAGLEFLLREGVEIYARGKIRRALDL